MQLGGSVFLISGGAWRGCGAATARMVVAGGGMSVSAVAAAPTTRRAPQARPLLHGGPSGARERADQGDGHSAPYPIATDAVHTKFGQARQVLGMTINCQQRVKALADQLAREPISATALEQRVLRHLWVIDDDTGTRARTVSARSSGCWRSSEAAGAAGTPPATAPAASGRRSTRSPSTWTTAIHDPLEPGAALVRGHLAQAACARAGVGRVM